MPMTHSISILAKGLVLWTIATSTLLLVGVDALSSPTFPKKKVTVVGGTGFTGARVCKILVEKYGASVTSVSKRGIVPEWCYSKYDEDDGNDKEDSDDWISKVTWKAVDLLSDDTDEIIKAISGDGEGPLDAIVSCVGVIGRDPIDLLNGNGKTNVAAFSAAATATPNTSLRAALVSVGKEVSELKNTNWFPEFFNYYFEGKEQAEVAALEAVDGDASRLVIIKPTFIYGGDSFGLWPPRVNYAYGSFIEELLSLKFFELLADSLPPGLIKVALRPPVSVDAVAEACAAAAMGEISQGNATASGIILDGTKEIKAVTNDPAPTGLTEVLEILQENMVKAMDWAKEEIPKAVDAGKKMIDEKK